MSKKKGKPVSWHVAYGPRNPRITLDKLTVVNHVLADPILDKQVRMRIEKPDARNVSIIVSDKNFNLMKKDIVRVASSKELAHAGIFLFGQGIMVAEFITKSTKEFRDKTTEGLPSEKDEEKESE